MHGKDSLRCPHEAEAQVVALEAGRVVEAIRNAGIVLTAAHVIEKRRDLFLRGPLEVIPINGLRKVSRVRPGQMRNTDPMDLGVVHLDPPESKMLSLGCSFVEFERDALVDVPDEPSFHRIEGYAASNNIPNVHERSLPALLDGIDVKEDRSILAHAHAQDYRDYPERFLGLRYDPRHLEGGPSRPRVDTLHGFSGGAVWRTDGKTIIGLAGIVTESDPPRRTGERLIFGIRSGQIREMLRVLDV